MQLYVTIAKILHIFKAISVMCFIYKSKCDSVMIWVYFGCSDQAYDGIYRTRSERESRGNRCQSKTDLI